MVEPVTEEPSGDSIEPGWYPYDDHQQRYWDGERWTEHFAPAAATPKKKRSTPSWQIWLACAAVFAALAGLWVVGTFDEFLAEFGLNANPCAENLVTGNMLCGDDLEDYCDQVGNRLGVEACREV